jgi:hypothetical protein
MPESMMRKAGRGRRGYRSERRVWVDWRGVRTIDEERPVADADADEEEDGDDGPRHLSPHINASRDDVRPRNIGEAGEGLRADHEVQGGAAGAERGHRLQSRSQ